jgi:hypothetical protein
MSLGGIEYASEIESMLLPRWAKAKKVIIEALHTKKKSSATRKRVNEIKDPTTCLYKHRVSVQCLHGGVV